MQVVQIVLWYLDSGCSKHMTGDRSQLINFVLKFLGTVKFGNDHVAKIIGYGDYKIGNVTISRVYFMEGLGHNLFSVEQFCDSDLEFGTQRTVNVAATREKVGSPVVQKSGHFAKECRKPKRVKDSAYNKEKMLLCKQAEQGVPLQVEQYDWLVDMDEEVDEQELKSHYSYMAKIQENEQNNVESDDESDDERVALANLKLDTKQAEFEKYKAFNDRTIDYNKLKRKLNEALGQLAQKDTVIKEWLKTKANEISVVKQKHDELIKQSLLTMSHYEGLVKQKMKVITDLKLREEHDIQKLLSMEKQLMFLNEVVYKRSQSIQTIHMMAPKVLTYNGRPTFANPKYLKQAQSEIPCLYAFPYDQNTNANRLITDGEETLALERESRSKLNKDLVCPYDYTTLNSLYEIFKPPTQEYETQLEHANEIRRKISRNKKSKEEDEGEIFYREKVSERNERDFSKKKSVPKTNVSEGLSKPVTAQTLPHTAGKAIVQLILFIVDSGCTKHMTGNLKLLCNFVEKFQVGQFCDVDLEVAFRKSTCFVKDLQCNDLLTGEEPTRAISAWHLAYYE
nr:integrase, catalytic region, zinc finger, CCHC-type, peptidase aspartic, catalytic [Tanacetum cinerariifolium]